jgi:ParB-like chromosome segregation protein Spo0J
VGAIYQSIEANGFYGAIVAQRSTGYILAGNHRYKAAVEAGAKSVPVIWVDVDDETAVRVLLADNRTNDVASYDNAVLAEILTELAAGPGLEGTGYDGDDLDQIIGDLAGDGPK